MRTIFLVSLRILTATKDLSQESQTGQTARSQMPLQGCVSPPSGVVGWWLEVRNAKDLIIESDGWTSESVTFPKRKSYDCFNFDGVEDVVQIPHSSFVAFSSSDLHPSTAWLD
jgi:hypothetical protein